MVGITISVDTGTTFYSGIAEHNAVAKLNTNTFVVAYRDGNDSNKGKAVVGTRIGTSITISESDIATFETNGVSSIGVAALSATKFVIYYKNDTDTLDYAIVGSVSGVTITFGSPITLLNSLCAYTDVCALDSSHFVGVASLPSAQQLYATICSVSGTTITVGTPSKAADTVGSGDTVSCAQLNGTDFVIGYSQIPAGTQCRAIVGIADIVAMTITWGASVNIDTFCPEQLRVASFDELHFVIFYRSSSYIYIIAGSINDITHAITMGTRVDTSQSTSYISLCTMDSTHFITSFWATYGAGYVRAGSLSGATTLAWDVQGFVMFDSSTVGTYTGICNLDGSYFLIGFKKTI